MKVAIRPVEVLLIEDNEADVELVREGLRGNGAPFNLKVIMDGREALNFLESKITLPGFIILDLNLPGIDGFELLKTLKSNAGLREIPVLIFSTSSANRDVQRAYELSANGYVRKPSDLDEFFQAVGAIMRFWFETASLPGRA